MNKLNKKIIVLTGALGLLGKSIAESMAKNNAEILMLDIKNKNEMNKIKDFEIIKNNLFYFKCDVTKINQLKRIEKKISSKFNKIDILINAAAVTDDPGNKPKPKLSMFENYPLKDWNKSLVGNLNSMFLCSQIFGKKMIKQKKSSIINIASTYGIVGPDQKIYINKKFQQTFYKNPAYPTSKGAVISFTKYLGQKK